MNSAEARVASSPPHRLLLVDGHAYAYRAFHAIRSLNAPSGAPTNAIYGFIKMLCKMQTQLAPSHQAVVWDGGLAAHRMTLLPEYKQQRPPMPGGLEEQIAGLQQWLEASGIASLCREGVEADDWIATLARQAEQSELSVVIASSDKDFMQLVSARIGLLNPNDKSERIWTADDVRLKTGVAPEQIVDWLSLIGDTVDNIPGVPGVGPKTATELLAQFGTIDALLARRAEVKSERVRTRLEAAESAVRRNQQLIRLDHELSSVEIPTLLTRSATVSRLSELYQAWGFKTLGAELEKRFELTLAL